MAGNAHANRHGHQAKVCGLCATAMQKLERITSGQNPNWKGGSVHRFPVSKMVNFITNCKPLQRQKKED